MPPNGVVTWWPNSGMTDIGPRCPGRSDGALTDVWRAGMPGSRCGRGWRLRAGCGQGHEDGCRSRGERIIGWLRSLAAAITGEWQEPVSKGNLAGIPVAMPPQPTTTNLYNCHGAGGWMDYLS